MDAWPPSLPLASPAGDPPAALAEHAATLAGLRGDARAQGDALSALGYLARGPGDDVAATVVAVLPLLPEVAIDTRVDLLIWLADVQTGGHRDQTVAPPERRRRGSLREDRAAVRAAVAAASDQLAALLDDPEPRVRSAAALALTFCVDASAEAKAALGARLGREREVGVQAALILALIRLGAGFRAPAPEPLIRGALAIATAFEGAPNLPELLAAMKLPREPLLAFNFGDLGAVAVGLLRKLDPEVQRAAAPELAAWAAESKDAALAEVALELVFGPPAATAARLPDDLVSAERQVARALVELDRLPWRGYGLPATVDGRRRFFGVDPAGPIDRFVVDGERDVPLWFALDRAGDDAVDVEALLADAAPAERLAIFLDADTYEVRPALGWKLEALLAAIADDRPAARRAVDELAALPRTSPRGLVFLRALAATRPGEPLAPALLDQLRPNQAAKAADLLAAFAPAVVEAWALGHLRPTLAAALAKDDWSLGIDRQLIDLAPTLAASASPRLARQLLLLGWASGQPAAVRAAVGAAGATHAAIAAVLTQYDALPEFTSWPRARAVLPTYAE